LIARDTLQDRAIYWMEDNMSFICPVFRTLQVAEKSGFQLLKTKSIFNHFHLKTPKNNPINLNKCFYSLKIVKTQLQIKKQPEITKLSNFYNKMKGINHHH
jgi:hypothetical protein